MDNKDQEPTASAPREERPAAPGAPKPQSATTTDAQPNESPAATQNTTADSTSNTTVMPDKAWLITSSILAALIASLFIQGGPFALIMILGQLTVPAIVLLLVSNAFVGSYLTKKAFLRGSNMLMPFVWLFIGQIVVLALSLGVNAIFSGGFPLHVCVDGCFNMKISDAIPLGAFAIFLVSIPTFCTIIPSWIELRKNPDQTIVPQSSTIPRVILAASAFVIVLAALFGLS